jgi:hypothetical protein
LKNYKNGAAKTLYDGMNSRKKKKLCLKIIEKEKKNGTKPKDEATNIFFFKTKLIGCF